MPSRRPDHPPSVRARRRRLRAPLRAGPAASAAAARRAPRDVPGDRLGGQPTRGVGSTRTARLRAHRATASGRSASGRTATPRRRSRSSPASTTRCVFEVDLLEQRRRSPARCPPTTPRRRSSRSGPPVAEAQVVGDLDALDARLEALDRARSPSSARSGKAERAKKLERGAGREGADRRRGRDGSPPATTGAPAPTGCATLLDEWKALPRLEKAADDALWRRFSTARTTYTRRRKAHFAELNEKREGARAVKEKLVKEAEALSGSTEWGPTAGAYRELMRRWKEAGPAPKGVDDQLWKRFRGAQDIFFGARDAADGRDRRGVRRERRRRRRRCSSRPRRCSRSPTWPRRRRPSATSPTAGTPPARSPASG